MSRSSLLALACTAALGVVVGRMLPRDTPSPTAVVASARVLPAPPACGAEKMQLASMRAQLAFCNARLAQATARDAGPATASAGAEPAASDSSFPPLIAPGARSMFPGLPTAGPMPDPAPPPLMEEVIVRHRDGTVSSYPLKDWPAAGDDGTVIARNYAGQWGYFAPDAGPDDPPIDLADLAGPDGNIWVGRTRARTHFRRRGDADAGAP